MKRVFQYLILAAVLIGLPLGCAWLAGDEAALRGAAAFPPRTEDWGSAEYWQSRCPFNWTMFVALAVLIVVVCAPFVRRSIYALKSNRTIEHSNIRTFPIWGWLGW